MNKPASRQEFGGQSSEPEYVITFTVPRIIVAIVSAGVILNACGTLFLAAAFAFHLMIGARP